MSFRSQSNCFIMSEAKVNKKITKTKPWYFKKQTFLAGASIVVAIALFYLNNNYKIKFSKKNSERSVQNDNQNALKYCIHEGDIILDTPVKVLNFLGLKKAAFANGDEINENCSLFWTSGDPFELDYNFKNMQVDQKINHIPGSHGLVSKNMLSTTTDSKYIPNSEDLQKYPQNPLLFDGHKFDFGVYVVITSVNPLRFYYYNDDVVIRLCSRPYDNSNFDDLGTYVMNDEHIAGANFKKIEEYSNKSYSFRSAMNDYFTDKGHDMSKVWNQVEDCIRSVIVSKNDYFIDSLKEYKSKFNFFELYRFDMILDDALNLYLMEVNQSPNISADKTLYEHVVYSTLNLVGVGSPLKRSFKESLDPEAELLINNPRSVSVTPEVCMKAPCNESCDSYKCDLCRDCMTEDQKYDTVLAMQEQLSRGSFKRLFPVSNFRDLGSVDFDSLSSADQMHFDWFLEMCKINKNFCSN